MVCCFSSKRAKAKTPAAQNTMFVPYEERSCTDWYMILMYLASWAGFITIIVLSMHQGGNPQKILHGVDFQARICGISDGVTDRPYAAWVAMPVHLEIGAPCTDCYQLLTCVRGCNETMTDPAIIDPYESTPFLHYCIPTGGVSPFAYQNQFQSATELASRAFADVYTTWPVILGSSLVAVIISFLYTFLSKHWAGYVVAFSCLLTIAAGVLVSVLFFTEAAYASNSPSQDRATAMQAMGAVSAIATFAFMCFLFLIRRQLRMAVQLVKEASRAILKLPWLVAFPFTPVCIGLAYMALFLVTTVYLATVWVPKSIPFPPYVAEKRPDLYGASGVYPTAFHYSWNQSLKNSFAYLFLHLLWSLQILIYFCYTVVGIAISNWYFAQPLQQRIAKESREQKKKRKALGPGTMSSTPVWDAIRMTLRFHLGTIILGALIMAIVNFIRAIVAYLQAKSASGEWNNNSKSWLPFRVQSALLCLAQCILTGLSCCMQQLNHFTFLWTGVFGDSFCYAAGESFQLVFGNAGHTAVLNMVGAYLMLCGKLFVSLATTAVSGFLIRRLYDDQLNSLVLPLVFIFIMAFTVAAAFMTVLETGINAIFFDFLVDEQVNASSGMMHASARLQKLVYKEVSAPATTVESHQDDTRTRARKRDKATPADVELQV